jgi:hypothetical protein
MNRLTLAALRLLCAFQPDGHEWFESATGFRCPKCRKWWSL